MAKLNQERTSFMRAAFQSKYFILLIVLLLGLVGYLFAPDDLVPGGYTATITVQLDGQPVAIDLPFILGKAGEKATLTESAGEYQFIVEGQDALEYRLGNRIEYRLKVLNENGEPVYLSFEQVSSTLSGPEYEQVLPPTQRSGDWLIFTMRVPFRAKIVTALLLAVATLWLTEIIPLAAASLVIPVVIVVTGVTDAKTVLQPFFHPIIVLFLAAFLLAEAMRRTGFDKLIALTILSKSSHKPMFLMLTMMAITAFLSMWMSNTASVAIIIPIAIAILNRLKYAPGKTGFRRALILGVAYAATVGGIGSAIGTPANILALTFLSEFAGSHLAFADWFAYGLPMVIIMIPIVWLYLIFTFRVKKAKLEDELKGHDIYEAELKKMSDLSRGQKIVLTVFVAMLALWLTEGLHHIHSSIIAIGGTLVLFFTETIKKEDLNSIDWNALLTFGGGLAIGSILVTTGFSDWVALQLVGLANQPAVIVIFLVAAITLLLGAFISNTATAAMLIPLAIPMALILHMDPRLLVAIVAIASSIDFALIVGTPPTMLAYSTGYFKASEIARRGVILDIIGISLLSFGIIWVWKLLGVVVM